MSVRTPALLLLAALAAGCTNPLDGGGGPGSKWEDYATGGGVLLVEIDHSPGAAPSQRMLDAFKRELGELTGKTVDTTMRAELGSRGATSVYTVDELRELDDEHQDERDRRDVVVMHALFVDGCIERCPSSSGGGPAGIAFSDDAFAIAMGAIRDFTCADGSPLCLGEAEESNAVRAVAIHEAGHLVGLVNLGLPMVTDHEMDGDPAPNQPGDQGEGHSKNERSVMWWQVELSIGLQNLISRGEQIPHEFDAQDLQDAAVARRS
ncbi:MAG: hypothetical protein ACREQY_18425 [Candidatus Binatia bacterium]